MQNPPNISFRLRYAPLLKSLLAAWLGCSLSAWADPVEQAALDDALPAYIDDGSDGRDHLPTENLPALEVQPNTLHTIDGLHQGRVPLNTVSPETLKTFVQVIDLIRREYAFVRDDDVLFYHAINGMLKRVDKNAEFLDAQAFANLQSFTEGKVASVGIKASWQGDENHWVVDEVIKDSPAEQAGVAVGDFLHQIGEVKLGETQTDNDITQLLSGILGTNVDISFSKAGRSKRHASLSRTVSERSSIEVVNHNGIAVIKLPVFEKTTRQQILSHISQIGTPIFGIVIDVRNNPGGVLESAADVASLFMRKQVVTQVKNRDGIERVLETQGSPIFEAMPVIILQNRYSASASEVLASALQTQKRALIVGETSYGKGSVQSVIPLGNGQGVKLTTAHYLTATGQKIDGVGVIPDVSFEKEGKDGAGEDWLTLTLGLMEQGRLHDDEGQEFSPVGGF